jgi:hypothetical protein
MGLVSAVYHAFVPGAPRFRIDLTEKPHEADKDGVERIRCPHCDWRPQASSHWFCAACPAPEGFLYGCGTSWNTFETRGRCPGCQHQWQWTSCHACGEWSLHDDWYTDEDDAG